MVPNLDDLEEMPAETNTKGPTAPLAQNKPALGGGLGLDYGIPTLDIGSRGSNRRFASRPANNNDVTSVYKPGLR